MIPNFDVVDNNQYTFECTRSRISLDLYLLLGKVALAHLLSAYPLQCAYSLWLNVEL